MARILWVTPYVPWPLRTGGRLRIAHLARELARGHRLAILATVSRDDTASDLGEAREILGAFADPVVLVPPRPTRPWYRSFYAPESVRGASKPELRRAALSLSRSLTPDAIVVEHSYTYVACEGAGPPLVIDEQNRESEFWAALKKNRVDAALTKAAYAPYERRVIRDARAILCCNPREARLARESGARAVYDVPNGVDEEAFPFALPSARPPDRVLFTGSFGHPPNAAAARWLAREIWPLVLARRPSARLVIAGHAPPPDVVALGGTSIEVVASAPSMKPYFGAATAYAAAVRAGAGTNLKTLEAASAGLALVATTKALDGHPLAAGRDCVVADDAAGFAAHLVAALSEPAGCDARAASARAVVLERCTWGRVGERLREAFEEILSGR